MGMYDYLMLVLDDIPNFMISISIIIILVLCTSYTGILSIDDKYRNVFTKKGFNALYNASYNKAIGYVTLLLMLDLSHVVIGHFEYNGFHLLFIDIPAHHKFYDIYITTFTVLFFKEFIPVLKNINKLGINLSGVIELADKLEKKFNKSLEDSVK